MIRSNARLRAAAALAFAWGLASLGTAQAGTVRGTVRNGTTGQLAPGVELTLVQPMGGMQELAHMKSGPQGEFSFDSPNVGTQPLLVQAMYRGVRFNAAVPPGNSNATVQLDIYEPSKDPKTIDVPSHFVIFQPNGASLKVAEEYQVENKSQPPQTYFRTDGTFDFALPEQGELERVDAVGPAGTLVAVNVSGTAPAGSAAVGTDQGQQGRDAQEGGGAESAGAEIQAVPGRLDAMKWPLLGGFVVVFGAFAYLLSRKMVVPVEGVEVAAAVGATATGKAKKSKAQPASAPAPVSPAAPAAKAPSNGPASLSDVDAVIGTSLDALKERLFRLELRHQAGTITEEDYAQERAKAEKVLRDLLRG